MPRVLYKKMKKHKAIWWKRLPATANGETEFEKARLIKCRWEYSETEVVTDSNQQKSYNTTVYILPKCDVQPGDMLLLLKKDESANVYNENTKPNEISSVVKIATREDPADLSNRYTDTTLRGNN